MKIESEWEIERILGRLVGEDVLLEVAAVCPGPWIGGNPMRWIPARESVLADELPAAGMRVYFQGTLKAFQRQIAFIYAWLDAPQGFEEPARLLVTMNGQLVGLTQGKATVRLAYPYYIVRHATGGPADWNEADGPRCLSRYR